jgi:MFS transporter, DHA1 family, tetracycline resistance protein
MKDKRLWIIFLIIFVNLLGFGIILPLMPYYVESFGAGAITIGLIAATYSLFQIISAPILGELSDKFGRRPILLISIGGTALSFWILGIAHSIPALFLSRIIDGATGGNISTAQAYIADVTTKENRTQGMGMMMAAFSLGFILGPALGGILSVYGYSVPAFVAGVVALIATILTYFFLPESRKIFVTDNLKNKNKKITFFSFRDFYDALTHPEVGLLLSISFMTMLGFSLMQGTFALFTQHSLNLTAETNGLIFAYLGLIGIVVQMFLLKQILKRLPEHKVIIVSIILLAISLGLIALSHNLTTLLIAVTFLALGNGISGPVMAGQISKLTPESEQGNVAGMSQSVGSVARLVGPLLGTFLYSQVGSRSPYFIATGVLFITVIFAIRKLRPAESLEVIQ